MATQTKLSPLGIYGEERVYNRSLSARTQTSTPGTLGILQEKSEPSLSANTIQYLVQGRKALAYVEETLPLGAGNKLSDVFNSRGVSYILTRELDAIGMDKNSVEGIREFAAEATKRLSGNCGAQAAVAFIYLMKNETKPLDYMEILNGDHAFVVVGRAHNSPVYKPEGWGAHAVVVDPWYGKTYSAASFRNQMRKGQWISAVVSHCRVE